MVFKSPGANVISTVDRVKALIPSMKQWLPEDVHLDVGMDKSITIRASLGEVEKSLLLSMALVILVVFLFLRNTRATSIPAVAAPAVSYTHLDVYKRQPCSDVQDPGRW